MRRREFIAALGGTVTVWPLAVRAQQGERVRRIGALMYLAADDAESPARVAAFARGLQELGWIEGRNIRIDYRWGGGDLDRVRRYAAELVALAPDVILVGSGSALATLQSATRTVPIVFVSVTDPVGHGGADRVRPLMMTVAAIIAGLLPIMWSQGTGAEVMQRIAVPMIGGMVSATVLTLLVIPAIYAV